MNQPATNIIQIPQENQFKPVKFELTPQAIMDMVKEYEALELIPGDKESYKEIHSAKMILTKARTGTDKHRKELGSDAREWINAVNAKAKELIAPLIPVEEKLKGMLDEEDQREAKIAKEKIDRITGLISNMSRYVEEGKAYNLGSDAIQNCITELTKCEISAVDFEEETERAEALKAEGLETLEFILADRIKWEADQAEAAKLAEANAAAAKKLAEEQAAFKAEQEKAAAEQKKKDDAAALIAAQEAEKTRKEAEKLRLERESLDREKAKLLSYKLIAEEKAYTAMWDEAHQINLERKIAWATGIAADYYAADWDAAYDFNAMYDAGLARANEIDKAIEKEKLKADKARAKLVAADKKSLSEVAHFLSVALAGFECPKLHTDEANNALFKCIAGLRAETHSLELAGEELV